VWCLDVGVLLTTLSCRYVAVILLVVHTPCRQHYLDQRRLQITADLQPPFSFLQAYQAYLSQVRAVQGKGWYCMLQQPRGCRL
jgi:hypothetical protein